MKRSREWVFLMVTSILTILILYIADQLLSLPYIAKAALKLCLISIFPLIFIYNTGENFVVDSFRHYFTKKRTMKHVMTSIGLGIGVFVVLILTYVIVNGYIDTQTLKYEMVNKYNIHSGNLVYYGLYLIFINSFLEEFFFRGYLFLNLKALGHRNLGNGFSAVLFSIYHIANFQNWFSLGVFILALVGLVVGGLIFNWLDDEEHTFFASWFVHMCADLAIVLIGFWIMK